MTPRLLVAGIGNIFLGDDGFGVEVAQRLLLRPMPEGVRVVDFGIRGLDLVYALLDGPEATILIDAVPRGAAPGTLFVLEPQLEEREMAQLPAIEAHSMNPVQVLRTVAAMGGRPGRMLLVGCQPSPLAADEMEMGLSAPVRAAVEAAVGLVESLIGRMAGGGDGVE